MRDGAATIGTREVALTNLDKVLFPKSGISKGDLVDYYRRVAAVALPHYRDRPLTMRRYPDGIDAEGFFQKDIPDYFPDWIERTTLRKQGGSVTHVVANDVETLVYLANQGCVTPHLGLARRDRPDHPDRLVLDLDPSDDDFAKVRRAANAARKLLRRLELPSFVQTTGSRGLHVVVPLDRTADFQEVREVARALAVQLAERYPEALTVEQRKQKRGRRVYVDYLRNAYSQTVVAPYAVRAIEGAPIATPVRWDDLGSAGFGPQRYTIRNIFRRLAQTRDPWSQIDGHAVALRSVKEKLA